jgi:hypothetical protein
VEVSQWQAPVARLAKFSGNALIPEPTSALGSAS